jgi:hypothetical protein
MMVVPSVIAAIKRKPPMTSQRIGPPRADIFTSMGALAVGFMESKLWWRLRDERRPNTYDFDMEVTLAFGVNAK